MPNSMECFLFSGYTLWLLGESPILVFLVGLGPSGFLRALEALFLNGTWTAEMRMQTLCRTWSLT